MDRLIGLRRPRASCIVVHMSIHVHHTRVADYADETKYTIVGHSRHGVIIEVVRNETTCLHPMRPWSGPLGDANYGHCLMDAGHRGRHATVVHYCDGCGKARRGGAPHVADENVGLCFMCAVVDRPDPHGWDEQGAW